ncbi:MAG: NAD-dependent protein deacylase [Ruminiclostridium sp.]|nr:NAD-dependent protein deacylase [Ruminiclostridium sp.]
MSIELSLLEKWINETDNLVFISGRDLSKDAGFPDYREMDEDYRKKFRFSPSEMLRLSFLQRSPTIFFRWYRERVLAPLLEAQPGIAHETLAKLEESGKLKAVLTVNIDGLHQEAGSRNVLELHGSVMRTWCAKCDEYMDFFKIADSPTLVPQCTVDMCGDYIRPAIVLEEEPYDLDLLARAMEYVRAADTLIIDGSALREFPVPNLMKAYQGHKLVLINTPPLVFDAKAGLVVRNCGTFNDIFSKLNLDFSPVETPTQP